jgi:glycosyltransferase involved in cell wall biosynthesis
MSPALYVSGMTTRVPQIYCCLLAGGRPLVIAKIGFFVEGMSGPGSGSWTRLSLLVQGLVSAGAEVHILGDAGVHEQAHSWGVASLQLHPRLSKVERFARRRARISAFSRATGCTIVHIEAPPFIGSPEAICLASIHDLREMDGQNKGRLTASKFYFRHILPRFAPDIDGWLALSRYGVGEIQKKLGFPSNSVFLLPPIVTGAAKVLEAKPQGAQQFVLALGHLEKRKNLGVLIEASSSAQWPSTLELWIAGKDHGELARLRALAENTRTAVRFLGEVDEDTKWNLLHRASIVAVPSLLEGFGLVAVEAPLAGTPALVANRTALIEVAAHREALVDAQNPSQWAERVAALVNDNSRRAEVLSAQMRFAQSFGSESVTAKLLGIHEKFSNN